jgi:hypothetical protein
MSKLNLHGLNKSDEIKSIVIYLADKFGVDNFKITDYWDEDFFSIGITENDEKYLVYFSIYGENNFYVSLENAKSESDFPYETVGDYDNVDIKELENLFKQHLRL